jgi:glutamine amidotransferase
MCRHLVYLGSPVTLEELILSPEYSLLTQAYAPRYQSHGAVNADGFGVGWYAGTGEPVRYRRDCPIWADPSLPELARTTSAPAIVAAVRAASAGMPLVETACAPFTGDGWLFSLNGRITGWPDSVAGLAQRLPVADLLTMEAPVDSALLWALVRHRLRGGASPAEAVAATVAEVAAAAPGSRLNLLLADPDTIVATTLTHSLSVRMERAGEAGGGSTLVSSEPLDDDPGWRPLPDGVLVVATAAGVETIEKGFLP